MEKYYQVKQIDDCTQYYPGEIKLGVMEGYACLLYSISDNAVHLMCDDTETIGIFQTAQEAVDAGRAFDAHDNEDIVVLGPISIKISLNNFAFDTYTKRDGKEVPK